MTVYATPDMVRNKLRVLDQAPPDVVRIPMDQLDDANDIQPHIVESDATAVTYCSGKEVPAALIASLSADLAAYFVVLAYRGSADFQADDPVVRRYQHAMSVLEDIGTGKISPVTPDDPDNPIGDLGPGATYNPPTPCLTTTDLYGRPTS
jgi:phage gp36-like protein